MAALRFTKAESNFFNWLAGFIDGEGCFYARDKEVEVSYGKYKNYLLVEMKISLRDDDAAILKLIQSKIGGRVTYFKPQRSASLRFNAKADCFKLIQILDKHPLRAKKRRDYNIWRGLVLAKLLGIHPSYLAEDLRQLREIKEFNK